MFANAGRMLLGALLGLAVAGCTGPIGPKGDQGPTGPAGPAGAQGPGFEAGPSISGVSPGWALVGAEQQVQISGFATQWTDQAVVSFGSGVTVKSVHAASDTALIVDLEVAADATTGTRNLRVTQGTETVEFKGAFQIKPVLESTLYGTQTQLSVNMVKIVSNDPDLVMPSSSSDLEVSGPLGVMGGYASSTRRELLVGLFIELGAQTGAADAKITLFPGTAQERVIPVTLNIGEASLGTLSDAAPATGTLAGPWESAAFKFTPATDGDMVFSTTGDATGAPKFVVLDSTGTTDGSVGSSTSPMVSVTAGSDYYVVVYSDSAWTGPFTLQTAVLPVVTDTEPNNDVASAQAATGIPFEVTGSFSSGTDETDVYKVTVGEEAVGRHFAVKHLSGYSDVKVETFASDGTTSLGQSNNLWKNKTYVTTGTITAAGDYYFAATLPSSFDGDYSLLITLQ